MRKLCVLLALCLLLGAAFPVHSEDLEFDITSEAVELAVPEEEVALEGEPEEDAGYAEFIGDIDVSASLADSIAISSGFFPDDAFRKFVLNHADRDKNFALSKAEGALWVDMDVSELGITDLTGIEYFPNLTELDCRKNELTSLDVSALANLEELNCSGNKLTSLDVSANAALGVLSCSDNPLTRLKGGAELRTLYCYYTDLASLKLDGSPKLSYLSCSGCKLESLDVSGNPELTALECRMNQLDELDVSHNPKLNRLECQHNPIHSIDLSNCPLLHGCVRTTPTSYENSSVVSFDDENGHISVERTQLVIDGKVVYAGANPGYHIVPSQKEYTINLAYGDLIRVPLTVYMPKKASDVHVSCGYATGVEKHVRIADASPFPPDEMQSAAEGGYVCDAYLVFRGIDADLPSRSKLYVCLLHDQDWEHYDEEYITIHVVNDPSLPKESYMEPEPTPKPTATPEPTATPAPTATPIPVGGKFESTGGTYRLGKDGAVTFVKPAKSKKTVTIPDTVEVNGKKAKVTAIGEKAFYKDAKLTTLTLGKYVKTVGKNAFNGCEKLTTVKGGAAVTTLKEGAFKGCAALTAITLESKVKTIGKNAFYGCKKLKTVKGGKAVTSIGEGAFKGCAALTAITLNSKVETVGKNAFYGCKKLKTVTIKTTKLTTKNVGANAFKGIYSTATFKCPAKKLKTYKKLIKAKGAPKKAKYK